MLIKNFLKHENNNLTLIRIFLSCMVIYYHSYALTGNDPNRDIVKSLFSITSSGGLAVSIFFFISGMLVCNSYIKNEDPIKFLLSRVFRVIPALFIVLFFTVFIVAPIVTNVSLSVYFSEKSNYFYIVNNLMMSTRYYLLGVFEGNHYKSAVNGSLWTLKWEVVCYLFLWCFGMINVLKNRYVSSFFCIFLILSSLLKLEWLVSLLGDNVGLLYLPMYFSIGCLFSIWKDRINISLYTVSGLLLLSFLLRNSVFFIIFFYVSVFSVVVFFASTKIVRSFNVNVDSSYGIYIYGFLIQQLLVHYFPDMIFYVNALLSITICLMLGYLSFKYIEEPSIRFGHQLHRLVADFISKL